MINVMRFKWFVTSAGIILGAGLSGRIDFSFEKWTSIVLGLGLVMILFLKESRWKLSLLLIFALLYGLVFVAISRDDWTHSAWRLPKKIIVMLGEVKTFPEKSYGKYKWEFQCTQFRMEEGSWHKTKSRVEVFVPDTEEAPLIGDRLIVKGFIRFPRDGEPGADWMQKNLFLKNIQAQIRVKKTGDMIAEGWNGRYFPLRLLQMARESLALQIEKIYSARQSDVLKPLLLGYRIFDPELRKIFTRTSTSHLLSVSGFHTAVIAGSIFGITLLLRLRPLSAVIFSGLGVFAYMALTGWGVAVQRAGTMAIFIWVAWVMGRSQPLSYWLNFACAVLLIADPKKIWDISFQLSFLSMYGILFVAPLIKKVLPLPGLDVSLAAFFASYPVVLYHFQAFSWSGIIANLVVVPAFALILPLGFLSLVPFFGLPAFYAVKLLLSGSTWVIEMIASISWASLTLAQPKLIWVLSYYALGGLWLFLLNRRAFGSQPLVSVGS